MVVPISCGRLVSKSVALRMPSFSMSAGRYVSTGFGPISSARGNVRASDDDTFHFGNTCGRRHCFLSIMCRRVAANPLSLSPIPRTR